MNTDPVVDPLAVFDIRDVAELLKCSVKFVQGLVTADSIPHRRLGPHTVRFTRADIQTYLDRIAAGSVELPKARTIAQIAAESHGNRRRRRAA